MLHFPTSLLLLPGFVALGVLYVSASRLHDPRVRMGLRLGILLSICVAPALTRGPGAAQLVLGLVAGYLGIRMVAISRRSHPVKRNREDTVADVVLDLIIPEDLFMPVAGAKRRPLTSIALGMAGVAACILLLVLGNHWRLWQRSLPGRFLDDQLVMIEVAVGSAGLHDLLIGIAGWCGHSIQGLETRPLLSTSLTEFWARRWNHMVEGNLRRGFFQPYVRSHPALGLLAAFTASGVLHVMAIEGAGPPLLVAWPSAAVMGFFLLHAGLIAAERRLGWHRSPARPWPRRLARLRSILVFAAFSPLLLDPFACVTHVHGRSLVAGHVTTLGGR